MYPPSDETRTSLASHYASTDPIALPPPTTSSYSSPSSTHSSYSSSVPPPVPGNSPVVPAPPKTEAKVTYAESEKDQALQTLTEANPVGASILKLNDQYYGSVLQQAQRSFYWALCAAIIGLLFFLAAVVFLLLQQPQNISYVSVICGALVEAISALNFYLYGRASQQLTAFHLPLDRTQRFILANTICETLQDNKEDIRAKLVLKLVDAPALPINRKKKGSSPIEGADEEE